jgi:hypothetical protein
MVQVQTPARSLKPFRVSGLRAGTGWPSPGRMTGAMRAPAYICAPVGGEGGPYGFLLHSVAFRRSGRVSVQGFARFVPSATWPGAFLELP